MDVEATRVRSRIMYIESKVESLQGRAPIGRVTFPEAGRIRKLLGTVQKPATSEAPESSSARQRLGGMLNYYYRAAA